VNARTNRAFLKLSVLSAISKYYNTGFMQFFLGVYINLFLGPFSLPWGPYMTSTYLFQTPPKKHQETLSTLKCFLIHSLWTNLETKYLSPVKPAGKFAIQPSWKWLCSLYHICIFHLQWQLNVLFMVNISYPLFLCRPRCPLLAFCFFPISYSIAVLYITCYKIPLFLD